MKCDLGEGLVLNYKCTAGKHPRSQGAFPWLWRWGAPPPKGTRLAGKFLATSLLRHTTNLVPDLPRSRKREISLFRVRQSEIWVRDYPVAFCHQTIHTSVTAGIPLLKRKLLTNINQGAYKKYVLGSFSYILF